ncbi:MAG: DUF2949 domain-containing protein [Acaryochloris sp. RU_4_1]|nr:DUF2949 domain-containing protein [Acaryochloris sp. RU_4_1]NJR56742.1 DUF2949 domain-containing protein [Acaryochloris sp. CRU_2_0]
MSSQFQQQFIHYLRNELAISEEAIDLALRRQDSVQGQLHIILWQHGLISLEQLCQAFDWLVQERVEPATNR